MKAQLGIAAAGNVAAWIAQWNAIADPVCTWLKNQSRLPSYYISDESAIGHSSSWEYWSMDSSMECHCRSSLHIDQCINQDNIHNKKNYIKNVPYFCPWNVFS